MSRGAGSRSSTSPRPPRARIYRGGQAEEEKAGHAPPAGPGLTGFSARSAEQGRGGTTSPGTSSAVAEKLGRVHDRKPQPRRRYSPGRARGPFGVWRGAAGEKRSDVTAGGFYRGRASPFPRAPPSPSPLLFSSRSLDTCWAAGPRPSRPEKDAAFSTDLPREPPNRQTCAELRRSPDRVVHPRSPARPGEHSPEPRTRIELTE